MDSVYDNNITFMNNNIDGFFDGLAEKEGLAAAEAEKATARLAAEKAEKETARLAAEADRLAAEAEEPAKLAEKAEAEKARLAAEKAEKETARLAAEADRLAAAATAIPTYKSIYPGEDDLKAIAIAVAKLEEESSDEKPIFDCPEESIFSNIPKKTQEAIENIIDDGEKEKKIRHISYVVSTLLLTLLSQTAQNNMLKQHLQEEKMLTLRSDEESILDENHRKCLAITQKYQDDYPDAIVNYIMNDGEKCYIEINKQKEMKTIQGGSLKGGQPVVIDKQQIEVPMDKDPKNIDTGADDNSENKGQETTAETQTNDKNDDNNEDNNDDDDDNQNKPKTADNDDTNLILAAIATVVASNNNQNKPKTADNDDKNLILAAIATVVASNNNHNDNDDIIKTVATAVVASQTPTNDGNDNTKAIATAITAYSNAAPNFDDEIVKSVAIAVLAAQ